MRRARTHFYAGGSGRFAPALLFAGGGLGAVYDPTDLTKLFQLSNGTTAVGANTDPVGYMADISGNTNHAIQATAGQRPALSVAGAIKALNFLSTSFQNLVIPAAMLNGWTAGTIIFAAKRNVDPSTVGNEGPVVGGSGTSAASNHYPYTDGNVYSDFLSTARKTCGDPGNLAAWHVNDFRSGANNWKAAFNGADYFTIAINTVGVGAAPKLGMDPGNFWFDGLIGRVIIINRVLTGSELASARTWVGAGSGLVL